MLETERTNRRLAAVMAADVVGYSRMMGADEAGTLAALKRHRQTIFEPAVARHQGRVVKLVGDGTLVEFASVVDAVMCALDVQRAIAAAARSGGDGIVLRIGINLGDVIVEGDDIYGDGVNVAARLEALADSGGVCISGVVNESVGNRVDVRFEDGGEVSVKNVARPIRVWKWRPGDAPTAATAPAEPPEPDRQSIAVLPFTNMSGDAEQEYFSDGITEDIITDLSKVAGLLVIARNSSFAYKGKNTDIRAVGRELGVRSVLEGSIRRAGNRVRITAQLIDAANGGHLWAERYDRDLTDIFAVQDEVTRHIVAALKVKLAPAEADHIAEAPTRNLEAHDLVLRARDFLTGRVTDRGSFEKVVVLFTRAIELDANYGEAYAGLAMAQVLNYQNRWTDAANPLEEASRLAARAIATAAHSPYAHYAAAVAALWTRDLDRARQEAEIALALSPNFANGQGVRGLVEVYLGNPLAAVPFLERAIRLDPAFAQQELHFLGSAYLLAGRYESAEAAFRERIRLVPNTDLSRGLLICALGHLDRSEEARDVRAELKQVNPKYSIAEHLARLPFRNAADADRLKQGFAKAGIAD